MKLSTPVERPEGLPRLSHADRLLLLGSCFTTHIGTRLQEGKFACDVNPYGVLYNPLSLSAALREINCGEPYTAERLYFHQDCWHSPMHHGDFSSPDPAVTLARINGRLQAAHLQLQEATLLMLTLGTAWVYEQRMDGQVVGNCHKRPEADFRRRRLSVEEIVADCTPLLEELSASNPRLKVLFTVSPIRHVRDGLHDNQLSKSTLLLAIDELVHRFPDMVSYFPAYELLMDELRDYRFYADDLVHPSTLAVELVWQRLTEACMTPATREVLAACQEIGKMVAHRPLQPEGEAYKRFLEQILLKIERLNEKCPTLDFQNERETCHTRLNRLQNL
ncbi:MAG: GSCFA domain-containing protein [Bacteroides sp.]|nr:GSCFA domain-containing protein [Bacteroides sp.]